MTDAKSSGPKPTSPELHGTEPLKSEPHGHGPSRPEPVIPGWRLILSDAGRLWASREKPFCALACHAGAERTVDADTLDTLRAETDRQESIAREAQEQAAGQVIS